MGVSVERFLAEALAIESDRPRYRIGGSGKDGTCDCIGLIIGAIRRAGETYSGLHGSNWAARHELRSGPVSIVSARQLEAGMVVFKARDVFDDDYDLPRRYDKDPDQNDYYHVGLVVNTEPLEILHCTTGGAVNGCVRTTRLRGWTHCGWMAQVDENGEQEGSMKEMTVTARTGATVNLRKEPSRSGAFLGRVPVGATVKVAGIADGWASISWEGRSGYMMAEYLRAEDGGEVSVTITRDMAEALREQRKR